MTPRQHQLHCCVLIHMVIPEVPVGSHVVIAQQAVNRELLYCLDLTRVHQCGWDRWDDRTGGTELMRAVKGAAAGLIAAAAGGAGLVAG